MSRPSLSIASPVRLCSNFEQLTRHVRSCLRGVGRGGGGVVVDRRGARNQPFRSSPAARRKELMTVKDRVLGEARSRNLRHHRHLACVMAGRMTEGDRHQREQEHEQEWNTRPPECRSCL